MRFIIPLALLTIGAASVAIAGPGGGHHGKHAAMKQALSELDLTDAQRSELESMRPERGAHKGDRQAMRTLKNDFQGELLSDDADLGALLDIASQMHDMKGAHIAEKAGQRFDRSRVLTQAQRAELHEKMKEARDGKRGPGHKGKGEPLRRMIRELDLTDAQRSELQALRGSEGRGEKHAGMREDRAALHAAMLSDDTSREAFIALAMDAHEAKGAKVESRTKKMYDATRILTSAQRAELTAQLQAKQDERRERHGKRGRR